MRNRIILILTLSLLLATRMDAKRNRSVHLAQLNEEPSFVVNEDGSVTFRYCGPGKRVYLSGDFLYNYEDTTFYTDRSRRIKMHRQSNGCFYVTTEPLSPETYTYCFRVNGKRKPDPLNNDTSWQKLHKWNVVSVGGTPQTDLYLPPEKQGELIRTSWYSTEEKLYRKADIYLPAGYDEGKEYPVLYLLHGINGYEGSWVERGRAIQILENLVEQGKAEPMILVMPDCNVGVHEDRPSHHTLFNNIMHYSRLQHDHRIEHAISELMDLVDTTYRVSGEYGIAGLSDGARIAANMVNEHPGRFDVVGMFCPVVHRKQLPPENAPDVEYLVYIGKRDMFFHDNGKRFCKRLDKQKNNAGYRLTETIGGHNWRNWRKCLAAFLMEWQAIRTFDD